MLMPCLQVEFPALLEVTLTLMLPKPLYSHQRVCTTLPNWSLMSLQRNLETWHGSLYLPLKSTSKLQMYASWSLFVVCHMQATLGDVAWLLPAQQ